MGARNGIRLNLSYLLFIDDTWVFCQSSGDHLCYFFCLSLCFEVVSGLKIKMAKLELFPIGKG